MFEPPYGSQRHHTQDQHHTLGNHPGHTPRTAHHAPQPRTEASHPGRTPRGAQHTPPHSPGRPRAIHTPGDSPGVRHHTHHETHIMTYPTTPHYIRIKHPLR